MTPERWEQIGRIYHEALELASAERAALLDRACAGDEALRHEVESLLAAEKQVGDFIAAPAIEEAAELIASEESVSLSGRQLGDYEILRLLGKGGMGEVYLARDPSLGRKVALKLLLADFTRDEHRVRRFMQEAKAVSALNHPNIITIHEIGEAEGRRYIATEFIEGQTLRQRMHAAPLKSADAVKVAIQIACALDTAHTSGIVHRDIKPENIMMRPDGLVKVLDFGLAKLTEPAAAASEFDTNAPSATQFRTEPGIILGTVAYMSPEQLRGQEVDARSDLFSLGVVCYELLSGRRPFTGETSSHVVVAILEKTPAPLTGSDIPDELHRIVGKALRKDREKRYQTAKELLADLKALQQMLSADSASEQTTLTGDQLIRLYRTEGIAIHSTDEAAAASTKTVLARLLRQIGFYKHGAMAAAAAVILLAVAGVYYFSGRPPALTERDTVLLADFVNLTGDEVFDSTLKQALAVQLEQSPYLSFFPEERIRETLRYMGRSPDEPVTKELGREICQRQGVKALLVGSIARFDRHYPITLEAINSQTGEIIARALAEAEQKDLVLRSLGAAAKQLRERLGESLASIQKFDTPLEQATTSSLNAFKLWSRGVEMSRRGKGDEAIPFYKHAKELDPNFAKADVSLSLAYSNLGQMELAAEYAAGAFARRDRVTERERFDIASNYHALATGDLLKAIEVVELWKQTYPRDYSPPSRLSSLYRLIGQFEKSLNAAREANQINPGAYVPHVSLGTALVRLNRFDEAQQAIERALAQNIGTATSRRDLHHIALIKGDPAGMKRQIEWASAGQDEYWASDWQAQSASFAGQLRQAQDLYGRAASLVASRYPERAAWFAEESLLRSAACGVCQPLKSAGSTPPANTRISLQSFIPVPASRALALALCGETGRAQALADAVSRTNPEATLANQLWLPVVRSAIELQRGNPETALHVLQANSAYEQAALFWPTYLSGQAHLRRKAGKEAAAEFQKILDHRGWDPDSPLWPLAQLGLARATALAGDLIASRQAYEQFFSIWKNADADLPILIEARKEAEQLNQESTKEKRLAGNM